MEDVDEYLDRQFFEVNYLGFNFLCRQKRNLMKEAICFRQVKKLGHKYIDFIIDVLLHIFR